MKDLYLYNTAHPLAESGKPIFIPFGEWRYDDARRQRLDRVHGERIANELNARSAGGGAGAPPPSVADGEITQEEAEQLYEEIMAQ